MYVVYFWSVLTFLIIPSQGDDPNKHPTLPNKTTPEIAARDGYPMEVHYITSYDGYILGIHRLPYSSLSPSSVTPKPAVILHHGIAASSSCWFLNSPGKRLPYMLADAGYDVWLANTRGNLYSRNHTYLNPNEKAFWDFSCQEMALFDLPALIDYILGTTGLEKVSYVGHSMGTTVYFMLMSAIPSYNDKITVSIALAPVVFACHMTCSPALVLAPLFKEPGIPTEVAGDLFSHGSGEFVANDYWMQEMTIVACTPFLFAWSICSLPVFVTFGFDYSQLNTSIVPDIKGHLPQGTSVKTFIHYGQWINSGRFCKYDYGRHGNQRIYGSDTPPEFPLENLSAPLFLFAAPNDLLARPEDLENLRSRLTGVEETFIHIDYADFNHMDFLFAIDANLYVNYPVLKILNKHNGIV